MLSGTMAASSYKIPQHGEQSREVRYQHFWCSHSDHWQWVSCSKPGVSEVYWCFLGLLLISLPSSITFISPTPGGQRGKQDFCIFSTRHLLNWFYPKHIYELNFKSRVALSSQMTREFLSEPLSGITSLFSSQGGEFFKFTSSLLTFESCQAAHFIKLNFWRVSDLHKFCASRQRVCEHTVNVVPILVNLMGWWCIGIVLEMWKYQLAL